MSGPNVDEAEEAILSLLGARADGVTICPSEAARGPVRLRRHASARGADQRRALT
jgi:Protein of unknown function (DUF3253)